MEVYSLASETNLNTGEVKIVPNPHSCQRYQCMKCYEVRYNKSMARLRSIGLKYKYSDGTERIEPFKTKRFYHCTVGIKVSSIDDIPRTKKYIEKVLVKFHGRMRKIYKFRGLRVFDLAIKHKDQDISEDNQCFVHFHYAIMPEKGKKLHTELMNSIISQISGGRIKVFKYIALRYLDRHRIKSRKTGKYEWRKGLFDYFAKRMSGYFGHKKYGNNFFLEEVMDWEEADNIFLHMRKLVVFSPSEARLGSKKGNISPRKDDVIYEFLGISFRIKGKKPPPKSWSSLNLAMRYILSQEYWGVTPEGRDLVSEYEQTDLHQLSKNTKISIGEQSWISEYFVDPQLKSPHQF